MVANPFVLARGATDDARSLIGSIGGFNAIPGYYGYVGRNASDMTIPNSVLAGTFGANSFGGFFNDLFGGVNGIADLQDLASGAIDSARSAGSLANSGLNAVAEATAGMDNLEDYSDQIIGSMNQFMNPYYDQVIDAAMGRLRDSRNENLLSIEDQAAASGAYGGGRHGLVESQLYDDYSQTAGELSSNLYQRQFDTALGAAHATEDRRLRGVDMNMRASQHASQMALQAAQLESNAQARQLESLLSAALGAEGQRQGLLGLQLGAEDRRLAGLGMRLSADDRRLASLGLNLDFDRLNLSAADRLQSISDQYTQQGMAGMQQQALAGMQQQALTQALLDQGSSLFDQFTNSPFEAIDLINAVMSGDPRRAAGTQTATTTTQPGLLDYLSLGTQLLGSWWGRP